MIQLRARGNALSRVLRFAVIAQPNGTVCYRISGLRFFIAYNRCYLRSGKSSPPPSGEWGLLDTAAREEGSREPCFLRRTQRSLAVNPPQGATLRTEFATSRISAVTVYFIKMLFSLSCLP